MLGGTRDIPSIRVYAIYHISVSICFITNHQAMGHVCLPRKQSLLQKESMLLLDSINIGSFPKLSQAIGLPSTILQQDALRFETAWFWQPIAMHAPSPPPHPFACLLTSSSYVYSCLFPTYDEVLGSFSSSEESRDSYSTFFPSHLTIFSDGSPANWVLLATLTEQGGKSQMCSG